MKKLKFTIILGLLLGIGVSIFITSCKEIRYVEVPVMHHDTISIYNTRIDSIRFYDSISVKAVSDTVYIEKFRYRNRYHCIHDSLYIAKTDTIYKVQVQEIERKLTKWESFKLKLGGWSLGLLLAVLVGGAIYLYSKLRR